MMKHDAKKFAAEARLPDDAGLPDRPGRAEAAGPAGRHRAAPRHHRPVRAGLRTRRRSGCGCKSLHPGKTLEQVRAATGFELEACDPLSTTVEPNEQQLCILRTEVDPGRYVLGRA